MSRSTLVFRFSLRLFGGCPTDQQALQVLQSMPRTRNAEFVRLMVLDGINAYNGTNGRTRQDYIRGATCVTEGLVQVCSVNLYDFENDTKIVQNLTSEKFSQIELMLRVRALFMAGFLIHNMNVAAQTPVITAPPQTVGQSNAPSKFVENSVDATPPSPLKGLIPKC